MLVNIKATVSILTLVGVCVCLPGHLRRHLGGMSHGERGYMCVIGNSLGRVPERYRTIQTLALILRARLMLAKYFPGPHSRNIQVPLPKRNMTHLPAFAKEPFLRLCDLETPRNGTADYQEIWQPPSLPSHVSAS